jgi:hypothetical protein
MLKKKDGVEEDVNISEIENGNGGIEEKILKGRGL